MNRSSNPGRSSLFILLALLSAPAQPWELCWHSRGPGGCGYFSAVALDTLNPGTVFVGSDVGGVYKSTDGGATWRIVNNGLTDYYVEKILLDPQNPGVVYLGTWGGVHKSTDGGATWQPKRTGFPAPGVYYYTAPIGALALDPQNPATVYAGIGMPRLGHRDQSRWRPVPTKGAIFKSTDYGETWRMIRNTGIDSTALISCLAVDPVHPATVYAVAHTGVYRSTDRGETWVLKTNGLPPFSDTVIPRSLALNPANPAEIYLTLISDTVGSWRGGVWKSTDGGELWLPCTTGLSPAKYLTVTVNPKNPAVVYTGAIHYGAGGVYKSTDSGRTWTRVTHPGNVERGWVRFYGTPQPYALEINPRDTALLFFCSEIVCRTTDAGRHWQQCYTDSIGPDDNWRGRGLEVTCIREILIDPNDSSRIYVGLADGGTWKSTDRGTSFRWIHDDLQPYGNTTCALAIHPESSNHLYAGAGPWVVDSGLLWSSTDAGETWTRLGTELPRRTIGPILIHPRNPRTLYLWINRHGVYRSTDGGATWEHKNNGLNLTPNSDSFVQSRPQVMALDPQEPLTLYLCIQSRGRVYKTTDGGDTWFPLEMPGNGLEPRGVALSPAAPGELYLWTRSWDPGMLTINRVYRSTDRGTTWESLPIFEQRGYLSEIRTLMPSPYNPEILLLGMTDYAYHDSSTGKGVFLSTDRGATWERANSGLGCLRTYILTFDPHNPELVWLGTTGNGLFLGEWRLTGFKGKEPGGTSLVSSPATITPDLLKHLSALPRGTRIEVFDGTGRKVLATLPGKPASHRFFPSGVYFVRAIHPDRKVRTGRVVVIR